MDLKGLVRGTCARRLGKATVRNRVRFVLRAKGRVVLRAMGVEILVIVVRLRGLNYS